MGACERAKIAYARRCATGRESGPQGQLPCGCGLGDGRGWPSRPSRVTHGGIEVRFRIGFNSNLVRASSSGIQLMIRYLYFKMIF